MKTPTLNYIYSKSAAQRIFDAEVQKVEILHNCILVVFHKGQGMRPHFISKSVFKAHFAEYRKAGSRQVHVWFDPLTGFFHATKSFNIQEKYRIELLPDRISCTCGDFATQEELGITKPTCKHCYAVLDYIGCTSLEAYVKREGVKFLETNETLHEYDDPLKDWHDEMMSQENYLW